MNKYFWLAQKSAGRQSDSVYTIIHYMYSSAMKEISRFAGDGGPTVQQNNTIDHRSIEHSASTMRRIPHNRCSFFFSYNWKTPRRPQPFNSKVCNFPISAAIVMRTNLVWRLVSAPTSANVANTNRTNILFYSHSVLRHSVDRRDCGMNAPLDETLISIKLL